MKPLTLATVLAFLHTGAWSVYVGGAAAMEFVWRPAQEYLPPSQINVVCQKMGRRYRWIALAALATIGASGVAGLADAGRLSAGTFSPASRYGRALLVTTGGWVALVLIVVILTVLAHPALHVRIEPEASEAERKASRDRVRRAIRRMDVLLRLDLVLGFVTALVAASLPWGGLV